MWKCSSLAQVKSLATPLQTIAKPAGRGTVVESTRSLMDLPLSNGATEPIIDIPEGALIHAGA